MPISVDYPADTVVSKDFLLKIDEYFTGISNGVGFVRRTLRQRAEACPYERIVLAGYSQGAMVMHRALNELRVSVSDRGILKRPRRGDSHR
jgi:predicted esterase